MKVCTVCGEAKGLDDYYFDKRRQTYLARCKKCRIQYNRDNKDRIQSKSREWRNRPDRKDRKKVLSKESYWRNRELYMWDQARRNRRGIEFSIDRSDVKIPSVCPIFKTPFDRGRYAPSLDRWDNSKGYIKGNVWVISKLANTMKNSASFKELVMFCQNTLSLMQEDIVRTT